MGRIASISRKIYINRQLGTSAIEEEQNLRDTKRIAGKEKRISINRVIASLNDLKRNIGEVDKDELESHQLYPLIEKLNIKLANFLTMMEKGNFSIMKDPLPIKEEWLDRHSMQLLQMAIEVEAFLKTKKLKLDYSSSAIYLAKMFEQEINNSIVHWDGYWNLYCKLGKWKTNIKGTLQGVPKIEICLLCILLFFFILTTK